ncbi:MAG: hypothetical protein LBE13_10585 [Bacteroidales bacterium]|nr:hypothetical protein [Bacteroidales bacterium]
MSRIERTKERKHSFSPSLPDTTLPLRNNDNQSIPISLYHPCKTVPAFSPEE